MAGLQGALEDCAQDLKSSEEKWRQSVLEGVKVSEELQSEQQRFIKIPLKTLLTNEKP